MVYVSDNFAIQAQSAVRAIVKWLAGLCVPSVCDFFFVMCLALFFLWCLAAVSTI